MNLRRKYCLLSSEELGYVPTLKVVVFWRNLKCRKLTLNDKHSEIETVAGFALVFEIHMVKSIALRFHDIIKLNNSNNTLQISLTRDDHQVKKS
jgi:hypothetical protein